jgi:hypothetical protein
VSEPDIIFGWRPAAQVAGLSERYMRQLARERELVVTRRADGAVGLRRADLLALGAEPRRNGGRLAAEPREGGATAEPAAEPPTPAMAQPAPAPADDRVVATRAAENGVGESRAEGLPADGEVTAVVFGDLRAGKSLIDIVAERKLAPAFVRGCHDQWRELRVLDGGDAGPAEPEQDQRGVAGLVVELRGQLEAETAARKSLEAALVALKTRFEVMDRQVAALIMESLPLR